MANGLRIIPQTLRSIDSATFTGAFQALGTPIEYSSPLMKFTNNSNVDVLVSWNGLNSHDIVPAGAFALYDFCSDAGTSRGLYAAQGTQFYVNGAASGSNAGSVYLTVFNTSEF